MTEYREVVAVSGETWDKIAYRTYGDSYEFMMDDILLANRQYSRVLAFEGGEVVLAPTSQESPYISIQSGYGEQVTVSLISAPW